MKHTVRERERSYFPREGTETMISHEKHFCDPGSDLDITQHWCAVESISWCDKESGLNQNAWRQERSSHCAPAPPDLWQSCMLDKTGGNPSRSPEAGNCTWNDMEKGSRYYKHVEQHEKALPQTSKSEKSLHKRALSPAHVTSLISARCMNSTAEGGWISTSSELIDMPHEKN